MDAITLWIAVLLFQGAPEVGYFETKAECMSAAARVEAQVAQSGVPGSLISGCVEVKLTPVDPRI